jgi:hypothetical protein
MFLLRNKIVQIKVEGNKNQDLCYSPQLDTISLTIGKDKSLSPHCWGGRRAERDLESGVVLCQI